MTDTAVPRSEAWRAIRSALKGARGLALDHFETALDDELARAINLLDTFESDARLAALDEVEASVKGLDRLYREGRHLFDRAEVLAAITSLREETPR